MRPALKRYSWTDAFKEESNGLPLKTENLIIIDDIFHRIWGLGRNLILAWSENNQGIEVLAMPHYKIAETITMGNQSNQSAAAEGDQKMEKAIREIISGAKMIPLDELRQVGRLMDSPPVHIDLPFRPGEGLPLNTISALAKRYSITYVEDRAVALFDIVEFSKCTTIEQVTQLNSLSFSVNTAYSKLLDRKIKINFARTTTGDGFYIWNRGRGLNANIDLYHFMHLVLADNAIAGRKSSGNTVPRLRTAFHVGGHYEFYQSEGLMPTTFSYIVGDVTIELARMIQWAEPGQILIGTFQAPMINPETNDTQRVNTVRFIEWAQPRLSSLKGLALSGEGISAIKCYLTGRRQADDSFCTMQYRLTDKHEYTRDVFNAKVNIYRENADPIFLGMQDSDLSNFGIPLQCTIF